MSDDMLERAKIALGAKTLADVSRSLGVATSVVSGYQRRHTVPLEQCIKIAEMTGVDLNWLILGKGIEPSGKLISNNKDYVSVPVYDICASAGNGSFFDNETIKANMPFVNEWLHHEGLYLKDLACIDIKGDSMMPTLQDGDTILVNRGKQMGDGIFVIRIGEQLRVKRLQWKANGDIQILSDNPLYPPEEINPSEIDGNFEIIGACHTRIGKVL